MIKRKIYPILSDLFFLLKMNAMIYFQIVEPLLMILGTIINLTMPRKTWMIFLMKIKVLLKMTKSMILIRKLF